MNLTAPLAQGWVSLKIDSTDRKADPSLRSGWRGATFDSTDLLLGASAAWSRRV